MVRANNDPLSDKGNSNPSPHLPTFPAIVAQWDRNTREVIRVELAEYNGRPTINVRVWYRDGQELRPTKSGLTLSLKHLPTLASALAVALANAESLGLLSEGGGQ